MLKNYQPLLIAVFVAISMLLLFPCVSLAQKTITINWSDLGINQWRSGMKLGDDFTGWSEQKHETSVIQDITGQILVPMFADQSLPATDQDWQEESREIYRVLKSRIQDGLASGQREFEVRTVQNINLGGYFNPVRQGNVVQFTQAFCTALTRLKKELSAEYNVNVNGIWASNGGYAASKVLPQSDPGLVDTGVLVDARAWRSDVKRLYSAVGGNLAISNTAGDAPARFKRYNIPLWHLDERMVAYHETAKSLKQELPGLRVYWVDPEGLDIIGTQHIKSTIWDTPCEVKEFTGKGYTPLEKMTGNELRSRIFTKSAADRGGVFIAPEPEKAGKGGSGVKEKVLESRPGGDTLSWPLKTND